MREPPALPADQPRRDLEAALSAALDAYGGLLTAGEQRLIGRVRGAPAEARSLLARLLARKPGPYDARSIAYAEIPDPAAAADALVGAGAADWAQGWWPAHRLAARQTAADLRAQLRAAGLPTCGSKATLVERVATSAPQAVRQIPWLVLRQRPLLRRLLRLGLADSRGDLAKLVVSRLGHVRYPAYPLTPGGALFPNRAALRGWERARVRLYHHDTDGLVEQLPVVLTAIARTPAPSPLRRRWSSRRFDEAAAFRAARHLEQRGEPGRAAEVYRQLLAHAARERHEATRRLALCEAALGRPADGARRCAAALAGPSGPLTLDPQARALDRTGRRLARKAGLGWRPLPPLREPPTRALALSGAGHSGQRPLYTTPHGPRPVEGALRALLEREGRQALHVEASLWTTLFALLLRPALFASVPGMLPAPLLRGPLDLRTPGFVDRRRPLLDGLLGAITQGDAPGMLAAALDAHWGESISGARWDAVSPMGLQQVAEALPGPALAAVLRTLASDWGAARRGLPDLVVLPGPAARLPDARPRRLQPGVVLVEVKGPTDRLSDAQRIWLHRLLQAGIPTELWKVERVG